jgi:hypothetical protein
MRKVKPRWRPLTSNSSEGRKQFLYHFPQLNPVFLTDRIANQVSVNKIIPLVFKLKSKCEISAHSLQRWRKLVSSSPFPLFLSARLTRSSLHFLDSSSRSRYLWSSLAMPRTGCYVFYRRLYLCMCVFFCLSA